jgi:hypothetical protein
MTRLRALSHFDIEEFWIRETELGTSSPVPDEPHAHIALPGAEPPFELAVDRHGDFLKMPLTGAASERAKNSSSASE